MIMKEQEINTENNINNNINEEEDDNEDNQMIISILIINQMKILIKIKIIIINA